MGIVCYSFISHRYDEVDQEKCLKQLNGERLIHFTELIVSTNNVKGKLNGYGPWSLGDVIQLIYTSGTVTLL